MAITRFDYLFWKELREEGRIPANPFVLELGQANWYGDINPACLVADIHHLARPESVERLLKRLGDKGTNENPELFIKAGVFYETVLQFKEIHSIDLNGAEQASRQDLNYPVSFKNYYEVVVNTGTAEHIFNQNQFFRTMHDGCGVGGIMVHDLPCWGWLDHGFYNYHPTFVADLAAANDYEIVKWWIYDLGSYRHAPVKCLKDAHAYAKEYGTGGSVMHAVCLLKTTDAPFQMPMQGHYAGTLDPEQEIAWLRDRT